MAVSRDSRHPALSAQDEQRHTSFQNRLADTITGFAGSMPFVYVHVVWFTIWIVCNEGLLGDRLIVDPFPYGLLTMVVSLEAIFLATFVMISQNRADEKREALAAHQWDLVQEEEHQNEELLALSRQILDLTKQLHALTRERGSSTQ